MKRPVVLLILDGWGLAPPGPGNAPSLSNTPNLNRLWKNYPHTTLAASGEEVGLPVDEVGNTETGHLNIGAGHIVYQDLPRINMSVADGSFYQNKGLLDAISHAKKNSSTLHVMGLIGSGGVHASNEHLVAIMRLCREQGMRNVQFHLFTDGRDSPPTNSPQHIKMIEDDLKKRPLGRIASIMGRYYAMDRDERWERTGKAYRALTLGEGSTAASALEAVTQSHQKGITDEFIQPVIITDGQEEKGKISDNDAIIFFNFRIDRPRQITKAFVLEDFDELVQREQSESKAFLSIFKKNKRPFVRGTRFKNLFFLTMTEYETNLPVAVAYPSEIVKYPLGRVFSSIGLRQLRSSESEKERFVTYYFNGQREMPFVGEDRLIIQSLKVATYDNTPEMRTREITEAVIKKIKSDAYDCIIINFAGPDMVGHTGNIKATISACNIVDDCIGRLDQAVSKAGGYFLVTADHGNCEEMLDLDTKAQNTEHSNNLVPIIIVGPEYEGNPTVLKPGKLGDIAPTILFIMELEIPIEMTGNNLLE